MWDFLYIKKEQSAEDNLNLFSMQLCSWKFFIHIEQQVKAGKVEQKVVHGSANYQLYFIS